MCISKKTVRGKPVPPLSVKSIEKKAPPKVPEEKKSECKALTHAEKNAVSDALAAVETQLSQEPTTDLEEQSPREPSCDYNAMVKLKTLNEKIKSREQNKTKSKDQSKEKSKKTTENTSVESKRKSKENVKEKEKEKKTKKKEEATGKKDKVSLIGSVNSNAGRSPVRNKKGSKAGKSGYQNPDDLSFNNDKTEFLENAQLTKLMSHADVKALMGGQMAQGADVDESSCRDTVEEVDSDMQDIAFSPLLAGIRPEEEKPVGVLPNPLEQPTKKPETT